MGDSGGVDTVSLAAGGGVAVAAAAAAGFTCWLLTSTDLHM